MQKGFYDKLGQATKWASLAEIAAKLISPITNAVLARILVPEAFGVVATLTLVVSFAEIFTDAGFQKYIVQHNFSDQEELDINTNVAFWTNLAFSLMLWAGIACFAAPITRLVGSPGCEPAVIVMCMQIPLLAFSSIQMARYRRELDFRSLFIARIITAFVPLIVTVPLALYFRSYWALVIGTLLRDILKAVVLTVRSKWRPRFRFSLSRLKDMLSFSVWSMVENITIWLSVNVDVFIVGLVLNTYYLGLYKTTIATINSIITLITASTTPVLFSALSRCQDDESAFREVFYRFQRMVALIVFPLGFGIFVYRELVTKIMLGNQWMETVDFLGLWALVNSLSVVFHNYNSEAFRSKGKPKLSVLTQLLHIVVLIPVLVMFMNRGYTALTTARCLVRFEMILASSCVAYFALRMSFRDSVRNVWPQLTAAVLMALAGAWLRTLSDHPAYEFATIFMCCVFYGGCMLLIPQGRKQLAEIAVLRKLLRLK